MGGALGAFAGRGLRAAAPASALGLRRAGLPQKLAGDEGQLVEGAGRWCGVRWEVAGHKAKLEDSGLAPQGACR